MGFISVILAEPRPFFNLFLETNSENWIGEDFGVADLSSHTVNQQRQDFNLE
jgi:hypothetical protein